MEFNYLSGINHLYSRTKCILLPLLRFIGTVISNELSNSITCQECQVQNSAAWLGKKCVCILFFFLKEAEAAVFTKDNYPRIEQNSPSKILHADYR